MGTGDATRRIHRPVSSAVRLDMVGAVCAALSRPCIRCAPDLARSPGRSVSSARVVLDVVRAVHCDAWFRTTHDDLAWPIAPQPLVVMAAADTQAALAAICAAEHHRRATPGAETLHLQRGGAIWTDAIRPSAMASRMVWRTDNGRSDQRRFILTVGRATPGACSGPGVSTVASPVVADIGDGVQSADTLLRLHGLGRQAELVSRCRFMDRAVAESLTQYAMAVWTNWPVVWN